ncbi:MAG: DegV family protein [Thermodesulfobacteriota bacterium]
MELIRQDTLIKALATGYERVVAWADILDRINVYPVPDGDTGRNLVITLSALRNSSLDPRTFNQEILLSARGNSGNIAARFLAGFLDSRDLAALPESAEIGRNLAYQAVSDPQPGTMLSLYDTLVTSLKKTPPEGTGQWADAVIRDLEEAVKMTRVQLPQLREAGVVDAGALGMLVFLNPFLNVLAGRQVRYSFFMDDLKESLDLSETRHNRGYQGYCLDVVLKVAREETEMMKQILKTEESLVTISGEGCLKIHLHTTDKDKARQGLSSFGAILSWAEDDLAEQTSRFSESPKNQIIHIMTDAAGSITREGAKALGITLLNSYITVDNLCLPETYIDPAGLFTAMKAGAKVSTSQASTAERHETYNNVIKLHNRVLYLCVGSFYTGNYEAALQWKAGQDPEDRMIIMDTGVASGKLGLISRAAAELALIVSDPGEVVAFAGEAIQNVREYIFLDKLHFLAAGGRMSKAGAFFGDTLRIKPIVSPFSEGARKMGVVRSTKDQVQFAFRRLESELPKDRKATLLLEYSDNRDWLEKEIKPEIERRFPRVRVIMQLLSLTSAAHMGPGSWGLAFLPDNH